MSNNLEGITRRKFTKLLLLGGIALVTAQPIRSCYKELRDLEEADHDPKNSPPIDANIVCNGESYSFNNIDINPENNGSLFYDDASRFAFTLKKGKEFHTVWMHKIRSLEKDENTVSVEFTDGRGASYNELVTPLIRTYFPIYHEAPDPNDLSIEGMYKGHPKKILVDEISKIELDASRAAEDISRIIEKSEVIMSYYTDLKYSYPKEILFRDGKKLKVDDGRFMHIGWWWEPVARFALHNDVVLEGKSFEYEEVEKVVIEGDPRPNGDVTVFLKDGKYKSGIINVIESDFHGFGFNNGMFDYINDYGRVLTPMENIKEITFLPKRLKG